MSDALTPTAQQARRFRTFSVASLAYTFGVIVFGAWVRVTGSGAGCGQHWPTCHGEAIPRAPSIATVIEFTHRMTSGLCLVAVVVMLILARRWFPKGHLARKWAALSVLFMITEALVGAGLVIFGLVEDNDSVARAASMTIHLVNTSILTGAMVCAAYWGGQRVPKVVRLSGALRWALALGAALLLITSMSGAVTALGDTLYPVDVASQPVMDRLQLRGHEAAHFLVRLRILHPIFAVTAGIYVAIIAAGLALRSDSASSKRWGNITAGLVVLQVTLGFINIALSAPGWMQLTHLAVATALWCSYIVLILSFRDGASSPPSVAP